MSDLKLLQQTAMAIMELVGMAGEAGERAAGHGGRNHGLEPTFPPPPPPPKRVSNEH